MGSGIALHYSVQKTFRAKRDAGCPEWLMDTTLKSGITHFLPTQYMPFCLKSFSVILQGRNNGEPEVNAKLAVDLSN